MPKRILIIYTGGTIGMKQQADGLAPCTDLTAEILQMPELGSAFHEEPPHLDTLTYDPLLDSSDMTPAVWMKLASDIETHYDRYDGFVVLHGTDTLAYTSSALSYFVQRSGKPVVVTGAQLPFGFPRSDAHNNLISALEVACTMPPALARVCVVFGSRILQGNRATKVSARAYDAFDSPRFPAMGRIGISIDYNRTESLPERAMSHALVTPPENAVVLLRLYPGFSPSLLTSVCSLDGVSALVLEAYGAGNGPSNDKKFIDAVRQAVDAGVAVVVVPQPLDGVVRMRSYAAGSALAGAGAISGRDMTTEAALTKLYFLVAEGLDRPAIDAAIHVPLEGEISLRD